MARTMEHFPAPRGMSRYDWSSWLDGRVWELIPSEDFAAKVSTFKQMAQTQARKRGGRIRTRLLERDGRQTLVMQFVAEQ
jgi:hypothetical protein